MIWFKKYKFYRDSSLCHPLSSLFSEMQVTTCKFNKNDSQEISKKNI